MGRFKREAMKTHFLRTLALAAAFSLVGEVLAAEPAFDWQAAEPVAEGFSAERLWALQAELADRRTKALLVIRNDRIVCEWYAADHSATKKHYTASMAKALVGGISFAAARDKRRIDLDDKAAKFIPQWRENSRKSKITIRQLGSHTSCIEDAEQDDIPHDKLTGWKGDFWKRLPVPNDPFTVSRDKAPLIAEPGTEFHYSNSGIALLTYCVTASMQDTEHPNGRTLLAERIMQPIGLTKDDWSVGYGQTFEVEGLPLVPSWGGGGFTARGAARVGRLMLREGDWDGRRLITADSVKAITNDAGTPGPCGIGWWTNADGRIKALPRDAYWAAGAQHQLLLVVPSLKLIAARNGGELSSEKDAAEKYFFTPLMEALESAKPTEADSAATEAPYPWSELTRVEWAPKESIIRRAKGGDNWPLTWGDDDAMYTAYGDGRGFEPLIDRKLSLGFARIVGEPADFTATNIRSPSGEQVGEGKNGKKASGLLMVGGVLYMWVRNAGNAELWVSKDKATTWEQTQCKFTESFGAPTFLNFGPNYAGARDDFVYVYSHDHDSAYEPADRMVLARVPRDRIAELQTYEYFAGLDAGQPKWTRDISQRAAVFANPGKCYRNGITHNAGLKRYLWCQILPGDEPRFRGGFGIYEAPEPWGPWRTVFYTPEWDVGPGETSSLPTKWMSEDGRTMHLVSSGDDCFSVRRLTLKTKSEIRNSKSETNPKQEGSK